MVLGFIFGPSQCLEQPQSLEKILLASKVVKRDPLITFLLLLLCYFRHDSNVVTLILNPKQYT